jgi:hypothetical protein
VIQQLGAVVENRKIRFVDHVRRDLGSHPRAEGISRAVAVGILGQGDLSRQVGGRRLHGRDRHQGRESEGCHDDEQGVERGFEIES